MEKFLSVRNLEELHQRHPDSLIFAHYAAALMESDNASKALKICQEGIRKHPEYAFGRYILGLLYNKMNNPQEAQKELEIALSLDQSNPAGWKMLAEINRQLDLREMSRDSTLKFYITDPFNAEAAENFYEDRAQSGISSQTRPPSSEEMETPATEEKTDELSEEDIESFFDTSEPGAESEDFEKTLDEVFQENVGEPKIGPIEKDEGDKEKSDFPPKPAQEPTEQQDADGKDEFTEAMDTFFSEYEKESKDEIPQFSEEEKKTDSDETGESVPGSEITGADEEDQFLKELEEESGKKSEKTESEFPEDFVEEEPIDFSAVVADIISEREEPAEEKQETKEVKEPEEKEEPRELPETPPEEPQKLPDEEESPASEIIEDETAGISAEEEAEDKGEAFEETPPETVEEKTVPKTEEKERPKFGRPPILSPTLGEIYIAQGRFEEAVDVFQQLLDKDPENERYKRKLQDLQEIIEKQKSGSAGS